MVDSKYENRGHSRNPHTESRSLLNELYLLYFVQNFAYIIASDWLRRKMTNFLFNSKSGLATIATPSKNGSRDPKPIHPNHL